MRGPFKTAAALGVLIVLTICQVDASKKRNRCAKSECSTGYDKPKFEFSYVTKFVDGKRVLILAYTKYHQGKIVKTGETTVTLKTSTKAEIKKIFKRYRRTVKKEKAKHSPKKLPKDIIKVHGGEYYLDFSHTTSKRKGKEHLNIVYKMYTDGTLVERKSAEFVLKTHRRLEIMHILEQYKSKIERLYKANKIIDQLSYTLGPKLITVFHQMFRNGNIIGTTSKTFRMPDTDDDAITSVLNEYRQHVVKNRNENKKGVGRKQLEYRELFPFTTNQATISGKYMKYKEKFIYTTAKGALSATFKLYNTDDVLVLNQTQVFPMESNTQGVIDRIMRQFTHTVHGGIEDEGDDDYQPKFQEEISYSRRNGNIRLGYKLYKNGRVVHNNMTENPLPTSGQRAIYRGLNEYVESIHRERELNVGWKKDVPQKNPKRRRRIFKKRKIRKNRKDVDSKNTFSYTTNRTEITGKHVNYEERFFYFLRKDELRIVFKLYNSNKKVVLTKAKTLPVPDSNQAEIDKLVRSFMGRVLGGATDNHEEVNVEEKESFSYSVGRKRMYLEYNLYNYQYRADRAFKSFLILNKSQETFDTILNNFINDVHVIREKDYLKKLELMELEEELKIDEEDDYDDDDSEDEITPIHKPKYQKEFPYTTHHATITGQNIEHTETFSYTADKGNLTATFKLYNRDKMLVHNYTQVFPMESNTQGVIDRIMRQFTHTVHGGMEDEGDENRNINNKLEFQEQIFYTIGNYEFIIYYKLYNSGRLVKSDTVKNGGSFRSQTSIDEYVNEYIEEKHRERQNSSGWVGETAMEQTNIEGDSNQEENKTKNVKGEFNMYESLSSYTANQILVTGTLDYKQTFSYTVREGKLKTVFKLYNANGRLVLLKTDIVSIKHSDNQAEIDEIMRRFVKEIGQGTGERLVHEEDEPIDESIGCIEKFSYHPNYAGITMTYDFYHLGTFVDSELKRFETKHRTNEICDNFLNKFIDSIHQKRQQKKPKIFCFHENTKQHMDTQNSKIGIFTGENVEYTDKFSFTSNQTTLTATFQLYNPNNKLIYNQTQVFPMESNTQGVIDRIMRQFTHTVHGGMEDQEGDDHQVNKNLKFQEKLSYRLSPRQISVFYEVFHKGVLLYNNQTTYKTEKKNQDHIDRTVLSYAIRQQQLSKGRTKVTAGSKNKKPFHKQFPSRNGKSVLDRKKPSKQKDREFRQFTSFTTNHVSIIGKRMKYDEQFSYMSGDSGIDIKFKLFNSNGRLVLTKTKFYPLMSHDKEAEFERIMKDFVQGVHTGTGETLEIKGDANFKCQETFSYSQCNEAALCVNYEFYNYGKMINSKSKTFSTLTGNQETFDSFLNKYIDYVHHKRQKKQTSCCKIKTGNANDNKQTTCTGKFPFQTSQATFTGENIKYAEKFSFTTNQKTLTATFQLYNADRKLIYNMTRVFAMENNTQGIIDRIMRQFTHTVHGGMEDQNGQDNQRNGTYVEHFLYTLADGTISVRYNLYKNGTLIHTEKKRERTGNTIQHAIDQTVNAYVESMHSKRKKNKSWVGKSTPLSGTKTRVSYQWEPSKGFSSRNDEFDDDDEDDEYLESFSFTSNQVLIELQDVEYTEIFSYTVGNGSVNVSFKLYNSNGKLTLVNASTFPIPDKNQQFEIDEIMRKFTANVHHGTGQIFVREDDENGDVNLKNQEKFLWFAEVPGKNISIQYDWFIYGEIASFNSRTFSLSQGNQELCDKTLYDFMEASHMKREWLRTEELRNEFHRYS